MKNALQTLVQEFGWVHLSVGLVGNFLFFIGSMLFLPEWEHWKTIGVWLFIIGSGLMLVGAAGRLLVDIYTSDKGRGSRE